MRGRPTVVVLYGPKGAGKYWAEEVRRATGEHERVSVEATGAWESHWMLAEQVTAAGCCRYGSLRRSRSPSTGAPAGAPARFAVSPHEAPWIHAEASRRAQTHPIIAVIDTAGPPDPSRLDDLLTHLR